MKESQKFLGRGWKFPVRVDPATGRIEMSETARDVRESIHIILATCKGERVMRPDFGCGIHDLVFESMSVATLGLVESSVRDALVKFEPRIEVLKVATSPDETVTGKLVVDVEYRVREANRRDNLVYDFYLRGRA